MRLFAQGKTGRKKRDANDREIRRGCGDFAAPGT